MPLLACSLFCGLVFGFGLLVSNMANPAKVLAFLDVAGNWDPSLAVVMATALAVTCSGYALARRLGKPLLTEKCHLPAGKQIDRRLIAGSALFGVGWGLVGLCPGPALVNLATLSPQLLIFVASMVIGMTAQDYLARRRAQHALHAHTQLLRADG